MEEVVEKVEVEVVDEHIVLHKELEELHSDKVVHKLEVVERIVVHMVELVVVEVEVEPVEQFELIELENELEGLNQKFWT